MNLGKYFEVENNQRIFNSVKYYVWRNRSIPTQFRTSESTHSVMKMT